ncbi:ubiquinone anaerobic biosynthesis accessory factor UbiT [Celeribacter neptunius]|uniref:Predicted lipid carrier protein YhbT, contains SCP2 domain n=1 Tax=Celeribacter neptunius TaxID=588602 RepID=A0A1I3R563_9RHOB|nr:SCP2 sterol-binding domain-containing protein [Celeribacter neptunius]SFJ41498.1 Predicted lipid carrier protein YhbT, contains SCP2 domain [Celeribacter neptunius]
MPSDAPRIPRPVGMALRPLPLLPLSRFLQSVTTRMIKDHPDMLRRLGDYAGRRFLIDITDLPYVLLLCPAPGRMSAHRRGAAPEHDVRLAGPLSHFLAMMHGAEDGDALFFSRDLTVEGDTSAALALRNAMDDAELDLTEELAALSGPFASAMREACARAERFTGLHLHRTDPFGELI